MYWTKFLYELYSNSHVLVYYIASPYAGGFQVGSPEPPFKINDIHSMHVVDLLVYTHLLALIHINYETEIDIDNVCKMFLQKHPKRMENSSLLFL